MNIMQRLNTAAALNQNVGAWRLSPGATEIELHLG